MTEINEIKTLEDIDNLLDQQQKKQNRNITINQYLPKMLYFPFIGVLLAWYQKKLDVLLPRLVISQSIYFGAIFVMMIPMVNFLGLFVSIQPYFTLMGIISSIIGVILGFKFEKYYESEMQLPRNTKILLWGILSVQFLIFIAFIQTIQQIILTTYYDSF